MKSFTPCLFLPDDFKGLYHPLCLEKAAIDAKVILDIFPLYYTKII